MKVVEIRDEFGLDRLEPAWNGLLHQSGSDTIFLTHEWAKSWWSAYGTTGELRILAAYDEAGALVAIAPLRARNLQGYGQTVSALQFIGFAPEYCDSDYLDFIVAAGREKAALEAFGRYWADPLARGTVLLLHEIPETSPNLTAIREVAGFGNMVRRESDVACGAVHLPETWEEYLGMLKPRFRTKVRSVLRNLGEQSQVRFQFCQSPEDVERLLPILFDLHTRRWQREGEAGVFGNPRKREFYRMISAVLLERGWLRFSWLEWGGRVLACQYGFVYNGVYSQLQEGYEPASEHWNVGAGLRAWSIRELQRQGVREYDFLGGYGRHKSDWGAELKQSKRILLAVENSHNILYLRGPDWEAGARRTAKNMLPEKVLRACRALPESHGAASEWVRRTAAAVYFHSGLPRLTRSLRSRYQLSKGSGFSWKRRAEATVRILYYHRVNDESDPFFGAISTDLFDRQMLYLARHYRVVSLPDAIRHLEEGTSKEPVVAVTFDDGYQDNYENAFPILKRYALPATVFLTTGSLDSREPLWFERMAEALKSTSREFLDLEFDIPRRFWLRTEAERVQANSEIFGLLRRLGNAERNTWLAEIIGRLQISEPRERKNKMLTWDQVRLMRSGGIGFGGHTVTHPFLSKLEPSQAAWEVSECKRRIEEELQEKIEFFAYPNGREEDFNGCNKEILRGAGYRGAVTTIWGMNYRNTDRMELRRGGPWEDTAALFAYKMDWYQLVNE